MKIKQKELAIKLRLRGYSINEIYLKTGIAKSTASLWVRNVRLSSAAKTRLKKRSEGGRKRGIVTNKIKKDIIVNNIIKNVVDSINFVELSNSAKKLLAAMLYWCEGAKSQSSVSLINSDPLLIKTFLTLLRSSFNLDERKFRVILHLHPYHKQSRQTKFWSSVTKIPESRFLKPYIKVNSGKNIKVGYPGCAAIYYYDYKIAIELHALWKLFGDKVVKGNNSY